jgi:hypothetical protein
MANKAKDIIDSIALAMLVVVFVVIAALIVSTITSNSVFTDIPTTGTNTNETLTNVTNITASTFAIISTAPTATCTLTSAVNATDGTLLTAGNYTFTGSGCTFILADTSAYIGEDLNVTYAYSYASGTSQAGVNVSEISEDFGSFVTNLIAFLAVIGTIIGVVWLVLYVRKLFDKKQGIQDLTA